MKTSFEKLCLLVILSGWGFGALAANPAAGASSFHLPVRKTYEGRCLVILRPKGEPGQITLKAEADHLKTASIRVRTQ